MKKASTKTLSLLATIGCIILSSAFSSNAQSFIQTAGETGVTIREEGGVKIWEGPYTGKMKPKGPLSGKTIGVLVASEFSDFQAQYIYSYASEFGGKVEFLKVGWVKWKFTRPNVKTKGVHGIWGTGLGEKDARYTSKSIREANPGDYEALIVLGGHSADIMTSEEEVINFIKAVHENDGVIGAIGGGSLPLIRAGIMNGKRVTGNRVVSFMLKEIARFENTPVASDGRLISARNTVNTPAFLRELCKAFDPDFKPERKDILDGKKILVIAGEDFEDIELAVPVMEYLYRGAKVTLATFPAPMRSRPPMVGVDVAQGNYGMSVPLQEIPKNHYHIMKLSKVRMDDFDLVQIPGAFCPWNMVSAGEPVDFLKEAHDAGKIIAAICHGPIAVSAADLVKGKKLAGVNACKDPVEIMGGNHSGDWSAVIDGRIVSGRVPPDIPEFLDAITASLLNGKEL